MRRALSHREVTHGLAHVTRSGVGKLFGFWLLFIPFISLVEARDLHCESVLLARVVDGLEAARRHMGPGGRGFAFIDFTDAFDAEWIERLYEEVPNSHEAGPSEKKHIQFWPEPASYGLTDVDPIVEVGDAIHTILPSILPFEAEIEPTHYWGMRTDGTRPFPYGQTEHADKEAYVVALVNLVGDYRTKLHDDSGERRITIEAPLLQAAVYYGMRLEPLVAWLRAVRHEGNLRPGVRRFLAGYFYRVTPTTP